MDQKVERSAEAKGIERKGWKGLLSNEGPKFKVHWMVWQIVFVLVILIGVLPLYSLTSQIPSRWNQSVLEEYGPMFVYLVYWIAWFSGSKRFTTWLFGPKPERKPFAKPLDGPR